MADSFLAYQNPSVTDKKLDSETLTVGANTVERERVQISGAGATDLILPVAHDAVDAGNPLKIGGKASSSAPADVSLTGDRVDAYFDMKGRQVVLIDSASSIPSHAVTNAGTFVVQENGAALTALQLIDNVVHVEDEASADGHSGVLCLFRRTTTPANTSGTDLDYEVPQMSAGRVWVSATVDTALPAGTNAIGKLSANSGVDIGDVDVLSLPALAAGTNNIGDVDVLTLPGVAGTVAHDGVDSGNPLKVGYKAIAHGTNPTAVAANDRSDAYCNRAGVPWVIGGHPNIVTVEAAYTGAQTNVAIVTVAAGLKLVVTQIQATCDESNTVGVGLRVGFATATTPTTTGVVLTHPGMVPGSILSRGDGSGILGVGADDEDLRITSEVPTGGSLRILVSYYTIES